MKLALIIGIGGFFGSISRYLVHQAILKIWPAPFPIGTFTINMMGSFLFGILFALSEHYKILSSEWRLFLSIGFCGSFTTYSTFALEGFTLFQQKEYFIFLSYTLGSLIVGILCAAAGYILLSK